MLTESRIYSFIDQKEGFTLHFFDGQKTIHDLAVTQDVKGEGFHFFRNSTLSLQHLIHFLKPGEGFGIYIDSDNPYFRLKLEMSDQGQMRALLLPDDLNNFPHKMNGILRTVKLLPNDKNPYTSLIKFQDNSFEELVNQLFKESYQLDCKVFLSEESDQSVMLMKLPSINVNKIETNYRYTINEYYQTIKVKILELHKNHSADYEAIQKHFESMGLSFLGSKLIQFKCNCSRDRMVHGLWALIRSSGLDHVFMENEDRITTKCDYCKTSYEILKNEFLN